MTFSIILPTYKAFAELKLCVRSLLNNSRLDHEVLILLDPNPKGEHSHEILEFCKKFPKIRCFKNEKNLGPYGSWNDGAKRARNEYLCFLTDDQYMAPNWDIPIVKHLTKTTILTSQLVESGIVRPYHTNLIRNFGFHAEEFDEEGFLEFIRMHEEDRLVNDGFFIPMVLHRDLFWKIGGWPTLKPFPYPNDKLFRKNLWKRGLEVQRVLNSFSYHFQNTSMDNRSEKQGIYFDRKEPTKVLKYSLKERIQRRSKEEMKRILKVLFGIQINRKVRVSGYGLPKKADMKLAYKYCFGRGVEIGPGSNRFPNIQTESVDLVDEFKDRIYPKPDYMGTAYDLHSFEDNSQDFVINSHLLEHLLNPIRALKEWIRILKPGGFLFLILPDKNLIPHQFDNRADETNLKDLVERYNQALTETLDGNPKTSCLGNPNNAEFDPQGKPGWRHFNYWTSRSIVELLEFVGLEVVEVLEAKEKNTGLDIIPYSWDDFTVVAQVRRKDEILDCGSRLYR